MLLAIPLVREASSELTLAAPDPVAVASTELRLEDREAMSEPTEDETEERPDDNEEAALLREEPSELLADEAEAAAPEVAEERALEMELATSVVVVVAWA